jgi:LPXTG-site transpeptidase (sortase) family protein
MTTRSSLRWIEGVLLLAGVACLVLWARPELDARAFQASQSRQLDADRQRVTTEAMRSPSARHARRAPVVASMARVNVGTGDVLGRLEVPRLRVSAIVAEGADTRTLAHAVGHVPSTALPGNPGNCALAGHRDSFLRGLRGVRLHDVIRVVTVSRTYTYRVDGMAIVGPRQVEVLDSTATRTLTLITCYPFTYVGHAPKRFVVRATQVDVASPVRARAEPATTFRPTRRR